MIEVKGTKLPKRHVIVCFEEDVVVRTPLLQAQTVDGEVRLTAARASGLSPLMAVGT